MRSRGKGSGINGSLFTLRTCGISRMVIMSERTSLRPLTRTNAREVL